MHQSHNSNFCTQKVLLKNVHIVSDESMKTPWLYLAHVRRYSRGTAVNRNTKQAWT